MNRRLEIPIVAALLVLTLPLQLTAWMVLRWQIGPPALFRQLRAGRFPATFMIVKYRTMTEARDRAGAILPDAQRITRATRLIRRLRLDELPQLWLILRGEMALVGPRPLLPETIRSFGANGIRRCLVAPGLTGWAQISGNTRLSDPEKLALDLWYVAHRSTRLDLRILAETCVVACLGESKRPDRLRRAAADLVGGAAPATYPPGTDPPRINHPGAGQ